ncbi:MAG: DTW domain-containing protein [Spirochaetes bacterium]|nr:DTW domain-containing protein [Spirochaetota bacterium]
MPRETCYRCWRPKSCCLCPPQPPMETRTRIVLLMHPMELRYQKCTTGRLTCLNLANSEIVPGVSFDGNARVRSLIDDPRNYPVLLYPGEGAMSIRGGGFPASAPCERRLVVFLIDATWHCSRKIVRESPSLMRLPRLTIEPSAPSRFIIKRQPAAWCLSTIEAAHELLLALEAAGLDVYPDKNRLLDAFDAMQDFQIRQTAKAAVRFSHHVRGLREPL